VATPTINLDTRLLYDAFTASPIGIAVETFDGQLLFANPALCRMLAFSEEEMLHKRCVDFSPVEDAEKDWALFQQLTSGSIDHYQIDKRYFRRDGSLVWGRLTVCLLKTIDPPLVLAMVDDISERKLAESRLQDYEKAVECADEMIVVVDRDFRYLVANRKYLLAHRLLKDQVIGRSAYQVLNPGEMDRVKQKAEECLTGKIVNFEIKHFFAGLGVRDVSVSYYPIESKQGVDGLVAILKDITERKSAEDALRESEDRFRRVADAAPVMIWTAGTDKLCTYVNRRWLEFTGHTPEQDLGTGWVAGIHPDDVEASRQMFTECYDRRERFRTEYRLRRHDGQYRWVLDTGAPWFNADGSFAGYIGSAIDVTERKLADDALYASEERLRLAQQAAHMGAFELNVQTGEATWTEELEAVYGLPPGGFGGTHEAFLDLVHPDDRAEVKRLFEQAIQSGQPRRGEWRIIWPDGSIRWVVGRWRVFLNERGEPSRALGVNVDVTERKLAEAAVLQMNRKLLEAQEQERARIGRELHDDINQRLAMVTMELDTLQHSRPKTVAERARRLDDIREQVVRISSGVQSLSHQLHPSQLEYLGIVSAMRNFCREFCGGQSFEIDFEAQELAHPVSSEVALCLFRILQEALHNAVKHSQARKLKVTIGESASNLDLAVSDKGAGFDVQAALNKGGLGLISMQERARLVNGMIEIESRPRCGTSIRVHIPFA